MAAGQRPVSDERVSTARQRASGLGLEAQRKTIEDFAASRGAGVLARFTEVESGRKADRPELAKALHLAKVTGATLVIANLDRPSRNAAFLLALRDSGGRIVVVDMPEANDLTVGIMALVSQAGREAISRWTKEALAVAKARRVKLANPTGPRALGGREKVGEHCERRCRRMPRPSLRTWRPWWRTSGRPGKHRCEPSLKNLLRARSGQGAIGAWGM